MDYRAKASDFGVWLDRNVGKIGYIIGTRGQICTQSVINYRLNSASYQSYWTNLRTYGSQWLGKVVADCMGIYEAFMSGGAWDNPLTSWKYPDTNTGSVYALAQANSLKNGTIATLPKNEPYPIAVGYTGHVGFYYKGMVYQSSGHRYGFEKTILTSTAHNKAWQYWYYLPWLDYTVSSSGGGTDAMLYKGCPNGEPVKEWQEALMLWNPLALPTWKNDGNFGTETEVWTNKFKQAMGLIEDNRVDDITYAKMLNTLANRVDSTDYKALYESTQKSWQADIAKLNAAVATVSELTIKLNDARSFAQETLVKYDGMILDMKKVVDAVKDKSNADIVLNEIANKY